MPLPGWLARVNRRATNRLMLPLAARLPGFGVIRHVGRKSGATYETPLNLWRQGEEIVVALTYGDGVDWLRNAQADGSSILVDGRWLDVGSPRLVRGAEGSSRLPHVVRLLLKLPRVDTVAVFPIVQSDQRSNTLPDSSD